MIYLASDFRGLNTSVVNPPGTTAKQISNLTINKIKGALQLPDGYAKKFSDGLPANDATIKKISGLTWVDISHLSVSQHNGQEITVAVGKYTKTGFTVFGTSVARFGVWIRPYWSATSSAWVDAWREVTEMFVFQVLHIVTTPSSKLYIDDGMTFNFAGADPTGTVFNTTYFNGWTIQFSTGTHANDFLAANDDNNYLYITGSGFDTAVFANGFYLSYFGDNANLGSRAVGNYIYAYRSIYNKELPSSLSSYIYGLLSDIRLTSGNTAADVAMMVGERKTTWGWTQPFATTDKAISEPSVMDFWSKAFNHQIPTFTADTDPLPAGTYYVKETIETDDGNETELRNARSLLSSVYDMAESPNVKLGLSANASVITDGDYVYVSDGLTTVYKLDKASFGVLAQFNPSALEGTAPMGLVLCGSFLFVMTLTGVLIKLDPTTMTELANVPVIAFGTFPNKNAITTDGTNVIVGVAPPFGTGTGVICSINSNTMAVTTGSSLAANKQATTISYDGSTYFYVIDNASTSNVYKCVLATQSGSSITLWPGDSATCSAVLGTTLFVGGDAFLCNVNLSTFVAYSNFGTIPSALALASDGTYLYIATATPSIIRMSSAFVVLYTLSIAHQGLSLAVSGSTIYKAASGYYMSAVSTTPYLFVVADGTTAMNLIYLLSPSTMPKRARYINVYLSTDNVTWYFTKQIGLYTGESTWNTSYYYSTAFSHNYMQMSTAVLVHGSDWNTAVEATVELGHDPADTGIINFSQANVVGTIAGAVGVLSWGTPYPNTLFLSASGGGGNNEFDVFPTDAVSNGNVHMVNLEYGDGDQLVAAVPLGDRWVTFKKRSLVLVSPDGQGGYSRDMISKAVGLVSSKAVSLFDDVIYFAGDSGIFSYSTRGLKLLNPQWLQDWKALPLATKQAAIAVFDRTNRQWRLAVNGVEYLYSIDFEGPDGVGEWEMTDLANQPTAYAIGAAGVIDWLATSVIETLGSVALQDGATFNFNWESNRIEILAQVGYTSDGLVDSLAFYYSNNLDVSANIYLDDSATPVNATPFILDHTKNKMIFNFPLSSVCKAIKVNIFGTTATTSDSLEIQKMEIDYSVMPQGGDILNP